MYANLRLDRARQNGRDLLLVRAAIPIGNAIVESELHGPEAKAGQRRHADRHGLRDCGNHPFDILVGETRVERQRKAAAVIALGFGERRRIEAVAFHIIWLPVDRNVVDLTADALLAQFGHERRSCRSHTAEVEHCNIEVVAGPRSLLPRGLRQANMRQLGESLIVATCDGSAALQKAIELAELRQAERRLDIGHAVVEAEHLLLVEPRLQLTILAFIATDKSRRVPLDAMATKHLQTPRQFRIIGNDRATLSGRNRLNRMK